MSDQPELISRHLDELERLIDAHLERGALDEGNATVFYPAKGGPCYRCLYPEPPPPGRPVDPAAVIDRIDDLLKPSIAVIGGFCT